MTTWTAVVAAVPLAWLLPNHYRPWPTAWQDGFVLALVVIAALGHRSASRVAFASIATHMSSTMKSTSMPLARRQ